MTQNNKQPQRFGSIASQTGGLKIGGKSKSGGDTASKSEQTPKETGKEKGRKQHTIYLPPSLSKWLKLQAVEEEREMSDIVADALEEYRESRQKL
jgi:hypothetical protein